MTHRIVPIRTRLLIGASATALLALHTGAAWAGTYIKTPRNPTEATVKAASQRATLSQAAVRATERAMAAFKRAAQSRQQLEAAQAAAAAAARLTPSGVPNGLTAGGLQVGSGVATDSSLWVGANLPVQSQNGDRTTVEIKQTQTNALLTWDSFNIGRQTDVIFNQQGHTDWIALNRVAAGTAPSQILGTIKASGTVLVINPNGIVFGAGSQINTRSLIASTLDVGPATTREASTDIGWRNRNFLTNGLLGYTPVVDSDSQTTIHSSTFSALNGSNNGTVAVEKGALINSANDGLILLAAPHVVNAGKLTSPKGQVILAAAETSLTLTPSSGAKGGKHPQIGWADPDENIRGLVPRVEGRNQRSDYYAWNQASGIIESEQGNIFITAPGWTRITSSVPDVITGHGKGAVFNDGALIATTSVSRNGSIIIQGNDVRLGENSLITILPDASRETIPQSSNSISNFKPSLIKIGQTASRVEIKSGSFLLAPGANVEIGAGSLDASTYLVNQSITIDSGASINVAGLTNVLVPISENQLIIDPAKKNELRDSPLYRDGFLNGTKLYLDPRRSGVRDDGVAWIGSPLINAAAYQELMGVGVERLMVNGGNVIIGGGDYADGQGATSTVVVRDGASIDISGGWVTYEAGRIRSSRLIDSTGRIVDIADADPNSTYVGVFNGFIIDHKRWSVRETWSGALRPDASRFEAGYIEGRDAGSVRVGARTVGFDGRLFADAFPGEQQIADGREGRGTSKIKGDDRRVQKSGGELPAGGALMVNTVAKIAIDNNVSKLTEGEYGEWRGGGLSNDGVYTPPTAVTSPKLPGDRADKAQFSSELLSNSGLSQVSFVSLDDVTLSKDVRLTLAPGGVFKAYSEGRTQIDGDIIAPSGKIVFAPTSELKPKMASPYLRLKRDRAELGDYDTVINGNLSVAGLWVNDYGASRQTMLGGAWLDGGSISITANANKTILFDADGKRIPESGPGPVGANSEAAVVSLAGYIDFYSQLPVVYDTEQNRQRIGVTAYDISGSIIIDSGSRLNLSGGGRIDPDGKLDVSARAGSLSLINETQYFSREPLNDILGMRLRLGVYGGSSGISLAVNPDRINAKVSFNPASIDAHGFGGGGSFTLVAPEVAIGAGEAQTATVLPLDFFSSSGFGAFNIKSNKTAFIENTFDNNYGGYHAVLATQTLTIGKGQTLSLFQSVLPNNLDNSQYQSLLGLESGGDVTSRLTASVPASQWDQKAVSLTLDGMLELHVAEGGSIVGAAGSSLSLSGLVNEGTIRIAGGTITQRSVRDMKYASGLANQHDALAWRSLSDIFSVNPDGTIAQAGSSKLKKPDGSPLNNHNLVADFFGSSLDDKFGREIYRLGLLDQGEGIRLAVGSVTDLSGAVIFDPRPPIVSGRTVATGRIIGGGTLAALPSKFTVQGGSEYRQGGTIVAEPGAVIDLTGAAGHLETPVSNGGALRGQNGYVSTPVWSGGGTLYAGEGGTFTGAIIKARAGDPRGQGGTLQIANPVFSQEDPKIPTANIVSADMISRSGFATLVAEGNISTVGDASIKLERAFVLTPPTYHGSYSDSRLKERVVSSQIGTTGDLEISAPYISLRSIVSSLDPRQGSVGEGSLTFRGSQIDITGGFVFDRSVSKVTFDSSGDIRLTGVPDWRPLFDPNRVADATLHAILAVNGDLTLNANRIYPTTGSSYVVTAVPDDGKIVIGKNGSALPSTPYSAGGRLHIQAADIEHEGAIYVPFGSLSLGGNSPYKVDIRDGNSTQTVTYAPATKSIRLAHGSVTSVSAGGKSIPYGTTTDTVEWYFKPTNAKPLDGPPAKVLTVSGDKISFDAGATVDLSGGGDVFAYEFVPGTGGSRDILSRFNTDQYSANPVGGVGYLYPDARQIYAIVPGLSDAPVAAYDPIYSSDYADLYAAASAGRRVYLNEVHGLKAGWYTLLPAKYALLPGGMRVVEHTNAKSAMGGVSGRLADGTVIVSGHYGDALSGSAQSEVRLFSVQSQDVIRSYSNIKLSSGSALALNKAKSSGAAVPRIGIDAGRLGLNPLSSLTIDATFATNAAQGGRGAQVDISGTNIAVVSARSGDHAGSVQLTTGSLNNLKAESLLIGGSRVDNADGSTNLSIKAASILVANDAANPLVAPEIILAVDDGLTGSLASNITLADGATLEATGTLSDQRSGAYIIDGRPTVREVNNRDAWSPADNSGIGALFRVANGPQRLVERLTTPAQGGNPGSPAGPPASLNVGNIRASGQAVNLDTSHNITVASGAKLTGRDIALGAPAIAFTGGSGPSGAVVMTPELQSLLSAGERLTLRSQTTIGFDGGTYTFGNVAFDAKQIVALDGSAVSITGKKIQFSNAGAGTSTQSAADGTNGLQIQAEKIAIGNGTISISGFGKVGLAAQQGIVSTGVNGVLNVGSADLALATSYIGDMSPETAVATATSMTMKSTGKVTITKGSASFIPAEASGAPGSSLTIEGHDVSISGARLRATAGTLTVKASGDVTLAQGAILEAPGYVKTFGDALDPQTAAAPAGSLTITAQGSGGIVLGDARLSVGGGKGKGGSLKLSAINGAIDWGGAQLDGRGANGSAGGTFTLESSSPADLVALNDRISTQGFTGGFSLRTRTGDIVLSAGKTLKSGSVSLTADGGFVTIGGTIDTSGINGGDITLHGIKGVLLEGSAKLDAHAKGYAADDTRQARAGDVTLGTGFLTGQSVVQPDGSIRGPSGSIIVASGATIDVSAKRPGNRLVRLVRNGEVNYAYVLGDEGGSVTFRAPETDGNVNVSVASAKSVVGARTIDLEGFKRWDLAAVAASGNYSGVTFDPATGTITLDTTTDLDTPNLDGTRTSVGKVNFLGDEGAGGVVEFVQKFDVSAGYSQLGGLTEMSSFRARPGIELAHDGNIVLASNWNLGAGVVNVAGALTDGLMATDPISKQNYVLAGQEGALLAGYTKMTYRVGADPRGSAPGMTLRAGGDLEFKGSLTDGFFQFRDQYDATYQSYLHSVVSELNLNLTIGLSFGEDGSLLTDWHNYTNHPDPWFDYELRFIDSFRYDWRGIDQLTFVRKSGPKVNIPFNAAANSPAALAADFGNEGDPMSSSVVFPLLPDGQAVSSSSYRLTAGAAVDSVDPLRIGPAAASNLSVTPAQPKTLTFQKKDLGSSFLIGLYDLNSQILGEFRTGQETFATYMQGLVQNLSPDAAITLPFAYEVPANLQAFIDEKLAEDPAAQVRVGYAGNYYGYSEVTMSLALLSEFIEKHPEGFSTPGGGGDAESATINLLPQTLVRTGTGNIQLAASGNIDLTGGQPVSYIDGRGASSGPPSISNSASQLGGSAIYTAGRAARSVSETLADPITGAAVTITANVPSGSVFSNVPKWGYGLPDENHWRDPAGIVIADTLHLTGGGSVKLTAQGEVLGRRDFSVFGVISGISATGRDIPWIGELGRNGSSLEAGAAAQPWRISRQSVESAEAAINPQLFREGIGALGGGGVKIDARGLSDVTVVSDTSLITGTATHANGTSTKALVTLGGGDVVIRATGDVLGARVDVPSGVLQITAGGKIANGPAIHWETRDYRYYDLAGNLHITHLPSFAPNETRLRISDATVDIQAGRELSIQGIGMLDGFYSPQSELNLLANGTITITNTGFTATDNGQAGGASNQSFAVYPGKVNLVSLMGDANLTVFAPPPGSDTNNHDTASNSNSARAILMVPNPSGQLTILAGGSIAPTKIAMLDSDPNYLPGLFTLGGDIIRKAPPTGKTWPNAAYQFSWPSKLPTLSDGQLQRQHNSQPTHAANPKPAYIYAGVDIGGDVTGVTLWMPKQTRVSAGRDIINMMFMGQNLSETDVTRIVAGRDIIGTVTLLPSLGNGGVEATMLGNSFVLGGPGDLAIEAGRNMGPFLNSAEILEGSRSIRSVYAGGIVTVGNQWNPYLEPVGANIDVLFGVGGGVAYEEFRDAYVSPGTDASRLGEYGTKLIVWMKENAADHLIARYSTTDVSVEQAYETFKEMPLLRQRKFLIGEVYFNELRAPAIATGPSYLKYSRGYAAVNTLFPASMGYTANGLEGGANDSAVVRTGDLDLRLAAIETLQGGDINIVGPGGRVLAGSVVATSEQAARRYFVGESLFGGGAYRTAGKIRDIPSGFEGVLTLRGGTINAFTDGDFLLNQSRLFTVQGGDITMWSSNADLNAGQGAKTTANFPPVVVRTDENAVAVVDRASATTGAGIAALPPAAGVKAPDVYLLAPRGTVDAGDAGIRVAGNLSIVALRVVNADNVKVQGSVSGIPRVVAANTASLTAASSAASAVVAEAAKLGERSQPAPVREMPAILNVRFLGFGAE